MSPVSALPRSTTPDGRRHAVVLGASMTGLLACRVLSDHFARVTLVERDRLPEEVENRRGVPQGHHLHVLQTRGEQILERLFPGLAGALLADGATRLDLGRDLVWYHMGGYNIRHECGVLQLAMSRPLLEAEVRRRVLALPNVRCLEGHEVIGLLGMEGNRRLRGVRVSPPGDALAMELEADLVIDATGRGSRSPQWLSTLGYVPPAESVVNIGYGYTSRIYRRDTRWAPRAEALYVMPTPPDGKRLGGLFPIEGGCWMVTLGGYRGAHPPAEERGFLEHARSLPVLDLYDVIRRAEPVSDFATFQFPASRWRHYERLHRFPAGYLVMGDAVCSFNPIYGQGMSVAAMEAEALDRCLRRERPQSDRLARRFFARAARPIAGAWQVAVGEDFRYAGTSGEKAPFTDLVNAYVGRVHRAAHRDAAASRAFLRVLTLTHPPASLFQPRVLWGALRAGGRAEPAPAAVGEHELATA